MRRDLPSALNARLSPVCVGGFVIKPSGGLIDRINPAVTIASIKLFHGRLDISAERDMPAGCNQLPDSFAVAALSST
jgi:hypothetical protein